jgi:hypothetical protein
MCPFLRHGTPRTVARAEVEIAVRGARELQPFQTARNPSSSLRALYRVRHARNRKHRWSHVSSQIELMVVATMVPSVLFVAAYWHNGLRFR